jgi:hypothetical protein
MLEPTSCERPLRRSQFRTVNDGSWLVADRGCRMGQRPGGIDPKWTDATVSNLAVNQGIYLACSEHFA